MMDNLVRDRGGIEAGPRRDHILFHLILTDYQPVLFSCIVFELQALALYQSSEIPSKRLGEVSYTGRASAAHPPARPIFLRGMLRGNCEDFYKGSCERCCSAF